MVGTECGGKPSNKWVRILHPGSYLHTCAVFEVGGELQVVFNKSVLTSIVSDISDNGHISSVSLSPCVEEGVILPRGRVCLPRLQNEHGSGWKMNEFLRLPSWHSCTTSCVCLQYTGGREANNVFPFNRSVTVSVLVSFLFAWAEQDFFSLSQNLNRAKKETLKKNQNLSSSLRMKKPLRISLLIFHMSHKVK